MDIRIKVALTKNGHDPNDQRFKTLQTLQEFSHPCYFVWWFSREGIDYWEKLFVEMENFKPIKNNKLNRKLYPDKKIFEDYLI